MVPKRLIDNNSDNYTNANSSISGALKPGPPGDKTCPACTYLIMRPEHQLPSKNPYTLSLTIINITISIEF